MLRLLRVLLVITIYNFIIFRLFAYFVDVDGPSMILGVIATGIAGGSWFQLDAWLNEYYERFTMPDGSTVLIQSRRSIKASPTQHEMFLKATQQVLKTAEIIIGTVRAFPDSPDGAEIKFGVKASSEGSLAVAKLGGEINYTVTLTWNKKEEAKHSNPELVPHDGQAKDIVNSRPGET